MTNGQVSASGGRSGDEVPAHIIDSHCHLADEKFVEDLPQVVARAREAGVGGVLCILSADEPDEVARAAVVRAAWPAVTFAVGVHPHRSGAYAGRPQDAAAATRQAATAVDAVAIGEIGLDYHYDFSPKDVQREVFVAQIGVALDLNRPVAIHARLAADDTVAVLREAGGGRLRGVMHCFSGTLAEARQALDLGFYISISGILTFPKASDLRDLAQALPADRLLIETDAPFLAPVPNRGRRNEPAWVRATLETLAQVRRVSSEEMARQIAKNFESFVGKSAAHA
jgi:TatD DNase family protein